ncbi:MAG: hypothetical protein BGO98_40460 [Myxococcales bacterium 68-20]|nr:MAG: hypothetical protein BGO98_40460 [Myxococcales bacterium 68-20]
MRLSRPGLARLRPPTRLHPLDTCTENRRTTPDASETDEPSIITHTRLTSARHRESSNVASPLLTERDGRTEHHRAHAPDERETPQSSNVASPLLTERDGRTEHHHAHAPDERETRPTEHRRVAPSRLICSMPRAARSMPTHSRHAFDADARRG